MLKRKIISLISLLLMFFVLTTVFPSELVAQERLGKITGNIVNIRKGPGTQYAQIAKVSEGEYLTILAEKDNWFQVKLADGNIGWVADWLLNEQTGNLETAIVSEKVVNIRKGPGTTFPKITQVKAGEKLTVLKSEQDWFFVKIPNAGQGWVASWLVKSSRVLGAQVGIINGSAVNVRQGAATTYPLLFQLNKGDQVIIKERKNDWCLVETNQGSGWVAAWLINLPGVSETSRNALVTGSVVNIRQKPGTNSPKVGQVKKDEKVEIIGQEQDWYQIRTNSGQEGWIASWLISLETNSVSSPDTSLPAKPTDIEPKKVIVTGNVVNVRQGPSLAHGVITKVKAGTELSVLGEEGDWLKVQLETGAQGWIAGWLTIDKNSQSLPQPKPYTNEIKITLDNERVLALKNFGDKLGISLSGIDGNQYQVKGANNGTRLLIELNSLNLRPIIQPLDNWGVKEIKITGQAVNITFDKKFIHKYTYNRSSRSLEMDVSYPAEQLVPVKQIRLNPQETQAVVQIASGRKIDYTTQEASPHRLVIDLPQSSLQLASKSEAEQNVAFGPIRKVTSRQLSPDLVRIEAEFVPGSQYQVTQHDDYIVVGAKITSGSLAGKTIVIDPGHGSIQPGGWTDPGAIGKYLKIKERDVNLDVALKLKQLLTQQGAKVVMTHSTGRTYLSLAGRADVANNLHADIFVSIHANYNTNRAKAGTSVYYYAPTWHTELAPQRWLRQRLALSIQKELVKAGGRTDLGIIEENFAVLRETRVPSVLVETAFLSNQEEERLLNTDSFRSKMAWGILKGIERYFKSL